ncbi:MAG: hypothetical protein V1899_08280 [Planctomycetota bacterium]
MAPLSKQPQAPPQVNLFTVGPGRYYSSKSWLWATGLQSLFTVGLLALAYFSKGRALESHVSIIMLIGIVATWGLALRAIRARLVELIRYWRQYSQGLIKRCSESGKHFIAAPLNDAQERYIKGAIWRLRIIAAGLTLPFFVMPIVCSFVAVAFSFKWATVTTRDSWAIVALVTMFSAFIVASYFHWVIMAVPMPVRISGRIRHYFPHRIRHR